MLNVMDSVLIKQLLSQNVINNKDVELLVECAGKYQTLPLALVLEEVMSAEQLRNWTCSLFDTVAFELSDLVFEQWDLFQHPLLNKHSLFLREHQILPISIHNQVVTLGTAEPSNWTMQNDFEFNCGLHTELVFCDPIALQQKIAQLIPNKTHHLHMDNELNETEAIADSLNHANPAYAQNLNVNDPDKERHFPSQVMESKPSQPSNTDTDPIIQYVDNVLRQAVNQGASDLHFEPYEHNYRIRFRVDGVLHNKDQPADHLFSRLAARIKVLSNMDIAEKRKPQDGRLKVNWGTLQVEFRVSTLPTIWGEKVVLRLLDTNGYLADVSGLGFEQRQQQTYLTSLFEPQGLILVTGPTGSGKTLTLYSGLNVLNTEDRNISTIEDPVEYHLQGINQVQVNEKAKLDFASSLRAFLRQDPDVVMVGEIRDLETAQVAIKAAHTGHLVLSTLHTNSAAETLNRLTNMGIPTYNLASAISLIIAQRLVRCLCEYCKAPEVDIPTSELIKQGFDVTQLSNINLFKAVGCRRCNQGYKGRVSIFELLKPNQQIRQLIMLGSDVLAIHTEAISNGMLSLRQAGLKKVISGVTSLEEVNRVVSH